MQDGGIVEQGTHGTLLNDRGRYYQLWNHQGYFHPPKPNPQEIEQVGQKEQQPGLIDVSDDEEAVPSSREPVSAQDTSANSSKINKTWKPEAPEFVPCNISRWKPSPVILSSNPQYSTSSSYTTNKQETAGVGNVAKLPTPIYDSKENVQKGTSVVIPGCSYIRAPTGARKYPLDSAVPRGNETESHENPQNASQATADMHATRRDWLDSPKLKRKRATRRSMSKSDPTGLDDGSDGVNNPSTLTETRKPPENGSPGLAAAIDTSTTPRRRRRNRHLKSKSPRKPLSSVSNGGPTLSPAAPSTQLTGGPPPAPVSCRESTSIFRFPSAT
jgi:hypothetical protein